jgi:hypothetical protein
MLVRERFAKPRAVAAAHHAPTRERWPQERHAVAFFAGLVVLCSVFASVPWKHMSYGQIDGYDDVVASQDVAAR